MRDFPPNLFIPRSSDSLKTMRAAYVLQYTGDAFHFTAVLSLLIWILWKKSCTGLSGKTQFLYALVFTTRYLDLFWYYHYSYYLTIGKILFLLFTYFTLILFYKHRETYEYKKDSFWIEALICPLFVIAAFLNREIFWSFSIYLEAVVMVPQLYLIYKTGNAEPIIKYYIFILGIYKSLYISKWCLVYNMIEQFKFYSGCTQVAIYFLYFIIPKGKSETGHRHSNILLRQKSFLLNPFAKDKCGLESIAVIGQEAPPSVDPEKVEVTNARY